MKPFDTCPAPGRRELGRFYKLASVKAKVISVDIGKRPVLAACTDG
jgi:hypothetical protein